MVEEDFLTNIARMIAAELYSSLSLQVAREMFEKSYFALGAPGGLGNPLVLELFGVSSSLAAQPG